MTPYETYHARVVRAWERARARLAPDDLQTILALLRTAHDEATAAAAGAPLRRTAPSELALVMSAIDDELTRPELADDRVRVLPDGTIMGGDAYEQLDPGWLGTFVEWLHHPPETFVPFRSGAVPQAVPDELVVGLLGDWGTGPFRHGQAEEVARALRAQRPDVTVHLGDVYHCGTPETERDHLIAGFPHGRLASFALNSNHEMFAGGAGYFETLLDQTPAFARQGGRSFFALENAHWVIVGLDSAYCADWKTMGMTGALGEEQTEFLRARAAGGKNVVVLTHHPGLASHDGTPIDPLWSQVSRQLDPGRVNRWYWGHNHAGYAHARVGPVEARCVGHGALPWGRASELDANPTVVWAERGEAHPWPRLRNGFAVLRFAGAALTEEIRDATGHCGWTRTVVSQDPAPGPA
ncbi:MAG: metallophosphoesterase [Candidatus Binatia bacterium]